jgi:hypothetical protein
VMFFVGMGSVLATDGLAREGEVAHDHERGQNKPPRPGSEPWAP